MTSVRDAMSKPIPEYGLQLTKSGTILKAIVLFLFDFYTY